MMTQTAYNFFIDRSHSAPITFQTDFIYIYIYISKSRQLLSRLPFRLLLHERVREDATPFYGLLHFTLDPYLIVLSVKQGGIKYHFLSLWYDSTWDWTPICRTIGEHSTDYANGPVIYIYIYNNSWKILFCNLGFLEVYNNIRQAVKKMEWNWKSKMQQKYRQNRKYCKKQTKRR